MKRLNDAYRCDYWSRDNIGSLLWVYVTLAALLGHVIGQSWNWWLALFASVVVSGSILLILGLWIPRWRRVLMGRAAFWTFVLTCMASGFSYRFALAQGFVERFTIFALAMPSLYLSHWYTLDLIAPE